MTASATDFFVACTSIELALEDLEYMRDAYEAIGQRDTADRLGDIASSIRISMSVIRAKDGRSQNAIRLAVVNN